jgi:hypothetical protein
VERALRVDLVGEREQVQLVGPAPVVEHEQPLRLAGRGALGEDERRH